MYVCTCVKVREQLLGDSGALFPSCGTQISEFRCPDLVAAIFPPLNDLTSLDFKLLNIGLEPTTVKLRVSHSID